MVSKDIANKTCFSKIINYVFDFWLLQEHIASFHNITGCGKYFGWLRHYGFIKTSMEKINGITSGTTLLRSIAVENISDSSRKHVQG